MGVPRGSSESSTTSVAAPAWARRLSRAQISAVAPRPTGCHAVGHGPRKPSPPWDDEAELSGTVGPGRLQKIADRPCGLRGAPFHASCHGTRPVSHRAQVRVTLRPRVKPLSYQPSEPGVEGAVNGALPWGLPERTALRRGFGAHGPFDLCVCVCVCVYVCSRTRHAECPTVTAPDRTFTGSDHIHALASPSPPPAPRTLSSSRATITEPLNDSSPPPPGPRQPPCPPLRPRE